MSASVGKMNSTSAADPVVLIGAPLLLATLATSHARAGRLLPACAQINPHRSRGCSAAGV